MGVSRNLIYWIPTNYGKWVSYFLFIQSDFIPGSRLVWVNVNRVYMDVSYPLTSMMEMKHVDTITTALVDHGFDRRVPFILCQREDFDFSDAAMMWGDYEIVKSLVKNYV